MVRQFRAAFALSIALLAAVSVAHGKANLESTWKDREITIDGAATDWEGAMTEVRDGLQRGAAQ